MATVRMSVDEALDGPLPATCLKCGDKAPNWVKKKFAWRPSWVWIILFVNIIPFVIVASLLTKRATMNVPLCNGHRRHWFVRNAAIAIGFFVLIGLVVALIFVNSNPRQANDTVSAIIGFTLAGGFVAWLIAIIVMKMTSIRPLEITDFDLVLQGVSEQFAEDFERLAEQDEARDRRETPRWQPRRDLDDDGSYRAI